MAGAGEAVESITQDPKKLMLVVGGGIAVGLAWRYWSKRKGGGAAPSGGTVAYADTTGLGLPTVGANAGSDRRDVFGSEVGLPVIGRIVNINGVEYRIDDAGNMVPLGQAIRPGTPPADEDGTDSPSSPGIRYNPLSDPAMWQELSPEERASAIEQGYRPAQ